MAFNALNEFSEVSAARSERRPPCYKCRTLVSLLPPMVFVDPRFGYGKQIDICWACWAGHPTFTRPVYDVSNHPHYLFWKNKIEERKTKKEKKHEV